mmetsp:Transcript_36743/g.49828  ORF Transcript_36743/g.49828 Transcript_36743/m.49828 type:complete len:122 (-) Transcript_36743:68-433(-)
MFHGQVDGGVDFVFTNLAPSATISTALLGKGGSDHDAISAVLQLGASGSAPARPPPPAPVPAQIAQPTPPPTSPPPHPEPAPEVARLRPVPQTLKDMMKEALERVREGGGSAPPSAEQFFK